jgi:hypothetical protein
MACCGAQAYPVRLFITFSKCTRTALLAYSIALLPFGAFNYWLTRVEPLFNSLGLIDLAGNSTMLALCHYAWRHA